jgi:hypothetical protein
MSQEQKTAWIAASKSGKMENENDGETKKDYGKQYAPTKMMKLTNDNHDEDSPIVHEKNIWTTVIPKKNGETTRAAEPRKMNMVRTVNKPQLKWDLDYDCVGITMSNNPHDKYTIHMETQDGLKLKITMEEAQKLWPEKVADYIIKNDMLILPGMEWAGRYHTIKPNLPCKLLPLKKVLPKHKKKRKLVGNRAEAKKKPKISSYFKVTSEPKEKAYSKASKTSKMPKGQPKDTFTMEELMEALKEMNIELPRVCNNITNTQEVTIVDSTCDTCAIGGTAWHIESTTGRTINITGHTDHSTAREDVEIVTAITATDLPIGETLLLRFNETSNLGKFGNTLLSTAQMRDYGVVVNDLPTRYGGNPHIVVDGYVIPLQMEHALMTFPIRKPTEHKLKSCTVVDITADMPWDSIMRN